MSAPNDVARRRSDSSASSFRHVSAGMPAVGASGRSERHERIVMVLTLLYAAALGTWFATSHVPHDLPLPWRVMLHGPLVGVAALFAWRTSRDLTLDQGSRRFWALALGAIVLLLLEQVTPAEALSGMPPMLMAFGTSTVLFAAMTCLPHAPRTPADRTKLGLDLATVGMGGVLLARYNVEAAALPVSALSTFAQLHAQAVLDLMLVLTASVVWRRTLLQHRANVLVVIGAALLVRFLGHTAAVAQMRDGGTPHHVLHVIRPIVLALLATAAWMSEVTTARRDLRPAQRARAGTGSLIPYAAALPAFGLLLAAAVTTEAPHLAELVAGTLVVTGLAFARQVVATREAVQALAESAARENEARFRALVQHSSDVITIVDSDGTIRYASPSMTTVFGHDAAALVGTNLLAMLHPDDVAAGAGFLDELAQLPERVGSPSTGVLKCEWRLRAARGEWMTVDNVGTNLLREPVIGGLVLNTRDVTEQSLIKRQYMHQAFHDPLTDLANRSLFLYQVGHALSRRTRLAQPVTVLFLDLDNFKTVNDSLGHAAGDRLLVEAARRLAACVRETDLIARLGGDEFAVLVEDAETTDEVCHVARRIGEALARPFVLGGKEVFVAASIGIARSQAGDSSDDLVRNADVAMYVAKTRGKGQHVLFEPAMHAAALERLVVEADLRRAIEHEEFFVEYQPIVELESGDIVGAEALVRWMCRDRGTVPPAVFIPIAEETGLIIPIGRWVLRRACRDAQRWTRERGVPCRITVNLSGRQLQDETVIDDVRQALALSELDPAQLVLEITESMLMHNTDVSMQRLVALKALGVSLAIDDFGTGYSSLSYLQRYPIDILKIDKAFVDAIDKGGEGPVLAQAIVALGETLRMHTVAEGIETEAQREHLLGLGCALGQGYLFAPPLHADAYWALLCARGSLTPLAGVRPRVIREATAAA